MGLILIVVGGIKIYLGFMRERPIGFLVFLLITSVVVLYKLLNPFEAYGLSQLGRRFLNDQEKQFGWAKDSFKLNQQPEGLDIAMIFAVFGIGVLKDTPLYGAFAKAFPSGGGGGGG